MSALVQSLATLKQGKGAAKKLLLLLLGATLVGCWGWHGSGRSAHEQAMTAHYVVKYEETFNITTNPSGAHIWVDDVYLGLSPVDVLLAIQKLQLSWPYRFGSGHYGHPQIDGGQQLHIIQASAEGYHTSRRVVDLFQSPALGEALARFEPEANLLTGKSMTEIPPEISTRSSLHVNLLPVRPTTSTPEPAGAPAPGRLHEQPAAIEEEADDSAWSPGSVKITSSHEQADVYVDGLFVGNVPATVRLAPGVHVIEVKGEEGKTFSRELHVLPGSAVLLRADFSKRQ